MGGKERRSRFARVLRQVGVAGLLVVGFGIGCGPEVEPEPLTFRYQVFGPPLTLDPAEAGDSASAGVIDRIYDGLMRLDRLHSEPVPELAASYSVSSDGLVYEFQLRPDALFHNGRSVQASDVKWSWERVLAPENQSPASWFLDMIEGAARFQAGEVDMVTGIDADDVRNLVTVRLKQPFVPFLYHLADATLSVVPREEVERLGAEFGRKPVGSGPFRFVSWEQDERVILAAFSDHAWRRPQVERLVYEVIDDGHEALRAYQAGELDLVTVIPVGSLRSLQQGFSADLHVFPGLSWSARCFRCDQPPFDDRRVRQAFALAVDREALMGGLGELEYSELLGFVPRAVSRQPPEALSAKRDLARARSLLAAAGYPDGKGFPTGLRALDLGPPLTAALPELGVPVETGTENSRTANGDEESQPAVFAMGWGGEYPDPEPFLRPLFHSNGPANEMAYNNPEVDRLLDAARAEQNPEERYALYHRAEALIIEDAPCIPFIESTSAILLRPRWQGIPIGFSEQYLEIELARLGKDTAGN